MASDNEACCESDPNFAVICGFLEKFGVTCGLTNIDFIDLQDMLENSQEVRQELVDLHVKLLRKARKSVSSERWERAIIKLCHGFCSQDAWEIERFGYKNARLSSKLRILKELLEMQFDYNAKFKNEINKLSAEELRTQPLGRDRLGHIYWFQNDNSCQIRVYKEDPDEETWALVAKDRDGLVNLITHLNDGQESVVNEDSNSLESEKPVVDTGQIDSNSNSNFSKQDQNSTDTNTEENQSEPKVVEPDSEKLQINDDSTTQSNLEEIMKPDKMRIRKKEPSVTDDSSETSELVAASSNGDVTVEDDKIENTSERDEKDKLTQAPLSPPKTGISLRIKPISELISSSSIEVNKKPEITGVKEKYIRTDSSSSSSIHYHRKAVDSAGFDVHTNYLKRPIEEEEDVEEPSYIKRPRIDRPTLLGNKKKKPYSDEEDEDDEEVSDEVEEPLMLVKGEGSGQDNEDGNFRIQDSPIVSEVIEESMVYFYGEGSGRECETGNENSPNEKEVASQQQRTAENREGSTTESTNSNTQRTSQETNKADTVGSINDSEPSSSFDENDCLSGKSPMKAEIKLGTIIDVRTNKINAGIRSPSKKSRWDMGKPDLESQTDLQQLCNNNSDTGLASDILSSKLDECEKTSDRLHVGNVDVTGEIEKAPPVKEQDHETEAVSASSTSKKTMFFFGKPGCLQVKPTISPLKNSLFLDPSTKNVESELDLCPTELLDETEDISNSDSDTRNTENSEAALEREQSLRLRDDDFEKSSEELQNNDTNVNSQAQILNEDLVTKLEKVQNLTTLDCQNILKDDKNLKISKSICDNNLLSTQLDNVINDSVSESAKIPISKNVDDLIEEKISVKPETSMQELKLENKKHSNLPNNIVPANRHVPKSSISVSEIELDIMKPDSPNSIISDEQKASRSNEKSSVNVGSGESKGGLPLPTKEQVTNTNTSDGKPKILEDVQKIKIDQKTDVIDLSIENKKRLNLEPTSSVKPCSIEMQMAKIMGDNLPNQASDDVVTSDLKTVCEKQIPITLNADKIEQSTIKVADQSGKKFASTNKPLVADILATKWIDESKSSSASCSLPKESLTHSETSNNQSADQKLDRKIDVVDKQILDESKNASSLTMKKDFEVTSNIKPISKEVVENAEAEPVIDEKLPDSTEKSNLVVSVLKESISTVEAMPLCSLNKTHDGANDSDSGIVSSQKVPNEKDVTSSVNSKSPKLSSVEVIADTSKSQRNPLTIDKEVSEKSNTEITSIKACEISSVTPVVAQKDTERKLDTFSIDKKSSDGTKKVAVALVPPLTERKVNADEVKAAVSSTVAKKLDENLDAVEVTTKLPKSSAVKEKQKFAKNEVELSVNESETKVDTVVTSSVTKLPKSNSDKASALILPEKSATIDVIKEKIVSPVVMPPPVKNKPGDVSSKNPVVSSLSKLRRRSDLRTKEKTVEKAINALIEKKKSEEKIAPIEVVIPSQLQMPKSKSVVKQLSEKSDAIADKPLKLSKQSDDECNDTSVPITKDKLASKASNLDEKQSLTTAEIPHLPQLRTNKTNIDIVSSTIEISLEKEVFTDKVLRSTKVETRLASSKKSVLPDKSRKSDKLKENPVTTINEAVVNATSSLPENKSRTDSGVISLAEMLLTSAKVPVSASKSVGKDITLGKKCETETTKVVVNKVPIVNKSDSLTVGKAKASTSDKAKAAVVNKSPEVKEVEHADDNSIEGVHKTDKKDLETETEKESVEKEKQTLSIEAELMEKLPFPQKQLTVVVTKSDSISTLAIGKSKNVKAKVKKVNKKSIEGVGKPLAKTKDESCPTDTPNKLGSKTAAACASTSENTPNRRSTRRTRSNADQPTALSTDTTSEGAVNNKIPEPDLIPMKKVKKPIANEKEAEKQAESIVDEDKPGKTEEKSPKLDEAKPELLKVKCGKQAKKNKSPPKDNEDEKLAENKSLVKSKVNETEFVGDTNRELRQRKVVVETKVAVQKRKVARGKLNLKANSNASKEDKTITKQEQSVEKQEEQTADKQEINVAKETQEKTTPKEKQEKTAPKEKQEKIAPKEKQEKTASKEKQLEKNVTKEKQEKNVPKEKQEKTAPKEKQEKIAPKKEVKGVSKNTRSQANLVKEKETPTNKAEAVKEKEVATVDIEDIEEQIVRTEIIRPSKKQRMSETVEVTVVDKNKRTVTTHTSEKVKKEEKSNDDEETGDKKEAPKGRTLRSSTQNKTVEAQNKITETVNKTTVETTTKDEDKIVEAKETSDIIPEIIEKVEELKPVDEPKCVQKKVPLLTCIDINKLTTTQDDDKSDMPVQTVDSAESDVSCGFADDLNDNDSSDGVVIIPESDPLASDDSSKDANAPMTLATFKLDIDESSPLPPSTRVTRKRAAQQSIDALRETRISGKKQEKKDEVDSKRPKLKKRSVDRNLRRSIEEQKLKEVSSSEEEKNVAAQSQAIVQEGEKKNEVDRKRPKLKKRSVDRNLRRSIEEQKLIEVSSSDDENNDAMQCEPTVEEGEKKSKNIVKRRISTRSTRATDSPISSSLEALSEEASRSTDASNTTPPVTKEKKPRKTKKTLLGLEIEETEKIIKADLAGVRQSRRIAQIKIKEEAERRKLEEVTLQELKDEQCKRKSKKGEDKDYKIEKRKRHKHIPTEDETTGDAESEEKKKRKRKRKHWNPTTNFDVFKAWKSSSGSSSSEIEDEEEEIEEDDDNQMTVLKSDHEFSPESDLEGEDEVQPMKRARTARKESDAEEVDDCSCQKCGQKDHPEWILLCDTCDSGWHCSCLRPALLVIPEGDWFCPPCQHVTLVKNLEVRLLEYDRKLNKREMETRRKERLAYVGISLDNVLPAKDSDEHRQKQRHFQEKEDSRDQHETYYSGSDESSSDSGSSSSSSDSDSEPVYQLRERRQAHSYRFNDYDELINSAIQDEIDAVKGAGNQGRGKDIATIVNAEKEEAEVQRLQQQEVEGVAVAPTDLTVPSTITTDLVGTVLPAAETAAAVESLPPVVPPNYDERPVDNDSDNEIIRPVRRIIGKKKHRKLNSLDVSSGDDAESDEDFKGSSSSGSDEDFDDEEYGGSSSDLDTKRGKRRKDFGPIRRSTRARISRYDREFIDDNSDTDGNEAPRRKKTRSLWDESESEESDRSWGRRKRKAARSSRRKPSSGKVKKSKKKKKRRTGEDSDPEVYRKRPNIKFGGLNDDEEEVSRRTRGKKINYLEALGTDSEEEIRRKPPRIEESEEEYNLHEDAEFQQQLQNEKDSDESGVEAVLQDMPNIPQPKPRGRGKSGLKIPRKPKEVPPVDFPSMMPDLCQPPLDSTLPASVFEPSGLQPLPMQPLPMQQLSMQQLPMQQLPMQSLSMQSLPMQPLMLEPPNIQDQELDLEDEPNPIEQINKNVEQMNEQEMEKMMEEEDYANKQLQLVALQIEKEKKRKEREAKRLEKLMEKDQKIPKKRGRKPKNQMLGAGADMVPPFSESSLLMNSIMANNAELSEPPGVSLPMFSEIAPVLNADGTPKKRRGRGKGKKTLAAEAAAIAAASGKDGLDMETGFEGPASSGSNTVSPAPDSPMHGSKLGIAAPPQPFSQSQPTPSVITRMLQSQSGQGNFPGAASKYFAGPPGEPQLGLPPGAGAYHPGAVGPRGPIPGPYQQPPPGMPHYPVVRSGPAPPHRLHSPGPPGLPPMYHTHRSMDPSPSGGGPINVSATSRDRHSPAVVPPASSSPLSKGDPTPPPPPYTRPQVGHFGPGTVSGASPLPTTGSRHVPMVPPHLQQHRASSMSPYHPGMPPNYHYGSYPPPPPLNSDDGQPPPVYPSPAYSEPYPGEGGAPPVQPPENSNTKPFDDDTGGEFVGLVSYFSSQREDDLDT